MTFQTTFRANMTSGVPGEVFSDSPRRAIDALLNSASAAYNIIGATAFTYLSEVAATGGGIPLASVAAGGTGAFAGILANPKAYFSTGTSGGGTLAPTLTLPNNINAELVQMGAMFVTLTAAANVGDLVYYDNTTGALGTTPAIASFTASQATTVVTVTGSPTGNIGVGSVITTGALVSVVKSLGTGTGGAGTYNVDTSQTVSSTAMTANSVAPTGKTFVPSAVVHYRNVSGAGLAVIKITN